MKIPSILKSNWFVLAAGLVLGALIVLTIRFATYAPPAHTHYHANFAVYINGQREQFKDPSYYTEVAACSLSEHMQPEQRAHMHDNVNNVVHVHDDGATWGQLFENLGWYVGPDFVQTRDGTLYKAGGDNQLHVLLNNDDFTGLSAITNQVIGDRDRLLISFGNPSEQELQKEFKSIPSTAKHYDESKDPASCAGVMDHSAPSERFKHLF